MTRKKVHGVFPRTMIDKGLTVSVCESCTGGMLSSMITARPGSSRYFGGGVVAYSNNVKERIVGVMRSSLQRQGAVSARVALEMAAGVRRKMKTDVGIGITGIAGPSGGSRTKPVGLVYIAVVYQRQSLVKRFRFRGTRSIVRKRACEEALELAIRIVAQ
jgi:nicotinamide-nucleotide amidase